MISVVKDYDLLVDLRSN